MLLLVLASLLWSVSFALIGQSGIDADLLGAARLGLAALLFAPLLARARGSARGAVPLMLIGAVQFGVMYVLVMRSYGYLAGHEVALLTITTPIFVILIEAALARRIRTRAVLAATVAIGAALALRDGAAIALWRGEPVDRRFLNGLALVQGANVAWAMGQVAYRRLERRTDGGSAAVRFGWLYVGAFVAAGAWAVPNVAASDLELTGRQVGTILYLGLIPSGLAFYLWNRGATRVSVPVLAVMNNLKVPLAVVVALLPPFREPFEVAPLAASSALFAVALFLAFGPSADAPTEPRTTLGT